MLNEEKVILMTKMAAFIDREGKNNDAINSYFKSDYVAFNVIKSLISATIVFAVFIAAYVLYDFEKDTEQLSHIEHVSCLEGFLVVLDKLQQEPCDEHDFEEHAEQQSFATACIGVPIQRPSNSQRC